ncbi:MAG: hypothetical protein AB1724_16930 [Thermodesulfobacteriota bacterium]
MFVWEELEPMVSYLSGKAGKAAPLYRAKVPGGWVICLLASVAQAGAAGGLTFLPDPDHKWDGSTLDWKSFTSAPSGDNPKIN